MEFNFLANELFEKPFQNTVFTDEEYASLNYHMQSMEEYMIKINTGQETPDNGRREMFEEHFAEVRRLTKPIDLPMPIKRAMASIYQTHPAFAESRLIPPAPPAAPLPPVDLDMEFDLSNFNSAEELNEYVAALGNLAIVRGEQIQLVSEADQKEIIQIIDIMEKEPERLPSEYSIDDIKSYYQALFRMMLTHEVMKRVTVLIAAAHQKRWKKNKLN